MQELEHAKQTISELEAALSLERAQLRSLTAEQDRMAREKKQVVTQLQRTESARCFVVISVQVTDVFPSCIGHGRCSPTVAESQAGELGAGDGAERRVILFQGAFYFVITVSFPENINAEQKARLLEKRVAENAETIAQLRQERSLLAADHKALQRHYSEISEVIFVTEHWGVLSSWGNVIECQ